MTSRTEYSTQTPNKHSLFDVQYLRNHRTLDIGVLGYIGIVGPKEHSPEVRSFPPGTPCIYIPDCIEMVYETFLHQQGAVRSADWLFTARASSSRWLGEGHELRYNYDIISHCAEWAFIHYLVMPDDGFVEEAETRSVILRENNSKTKFWLRDWQCLIIPNVVCTSQREVPHYKGHVKYKHQLRPLLVCSSHEVYKINV